MPPVLCMRIGGIAFWVLYSTSNKISNLLVINIVMLQPPHYYSYD